MEMPADGMLDKKKTMRPIAVGVGWGRRWGRDPRLFVQWSSAQTGSVSHYLNLIEESEASG